MEEEKNNRVSWVDSTDPIIPGSKGKAQEPHTMYASASRADMVVDDLSSDGSGMETKGCWNIWQEYPKHVFLIVGNEFCERFSYYGMRTVLTLYIVNILMFSESNSVAMYHGFIVLCYTSPVIGSILADGYIGKYYTILWISLLYASGNIVLAVAATFDKGSVAHPALDFIGLIIIAFGTGGIKPCVSAFGGDQFKKGQERILETFFSVFYFSINAGATISSFITPYLRVTPCLGRDTCYPLAFGVPAVLMVVSVIFFVLGSGLYTKYPPKENVMLEVVKTMKSALSNRRFFTVKRDHWLDHHLDNHSCANDMKCMDFKKAGKGPCFQAQFVADVKAFLRVSIMYLPVPVFWALYDLQGSRWVLQGVAMDGHLWKGAVLLPDQMPTLNAVLIMLFIPIFQGVIYPLVKKIGIDPTPLRRMTAGGLLASASFVIAMFVQFGVNKTLSHPPAINEVHLAFQNSWPCNLTLAANPANSVPGVTGPLIVPQNGSLKIEHIMLNNQQKSTFNWNVTGSCLQNSAGASSLTLQTPVQASYSWYTVLSPQSSPLGIHGNSTFQANLEKPTTGEGQFKISVVWMVLSPALKNQQFLFCSPEEGNYAHPCVPKDDDNMQPITISSFKASPYVELKPRYWQLYMVNGTDSWNTRTTSPAYLAKYLTSTNISFSVYGQGAVYSLTVDAPSLHQINVSNQNRYTIVPSNQLSILWQIPQYVVVTAAEILFSITGLEFSYSQAPNSMKSVIQAVWLLTVAGGDFIDLVIAELRIFDNLAWELLLYAGLMAAVIVIFALMAQFWYEYVHYTRDEEDAEVTETKA